MTELGKVFIVLGLLLTGIGLLFWAGIGRGWLGRLPGDIQYHKNNFTFYFPFATCLIISLLISLLLWLFRR